MSKIIYSTNSLKTSIYLQKLFYPQNKISLSYTLFKICLFFLYSFIPTQKTNAQEIPIGSWRTHFNYNQANAIANGENKSYIATQNGFFMVDWTDNNVQTLSKIDGFAGGQISALAFDNNHKTLIIAYQNSEIELLTNNQIKNISLLKDLNTSNSKKINDIFITQQLAYLATDLGVVIIDLKKQEIKETYQNLGATGNNLPILSCAVAQNKIFLATSQGVMMGNLEDNLLDFSLWTRFSSSQGNIPNQNTLKIQSLQEKIYAWQNGNGLYQYNFANNNWQSITSPNITLVNLQKNDEKLFLLENNGRIWSVNAQNNTTLENIPLTKQAKFLIGQGEKIYIADQKIGFLSNHTGQWQRYTPSGTNIVNMGKIYYQNEKITATTRGFDANFNGNADILGIDFFKNGEWRSQDFSQNASLNIFRDISGIAYQKQEQSYYISTFGKGIIKLKNDNSTEIINQTTPNTTLNVDINGNINLADICVGKNGEVAIVQNGNNAQNLHIKRTDNSWLSYSALNVGLFQAKKIFVDNQNNKWTILSPSTGASLWVLNDQQNRQRTLSTLQNQGNLPDINVNTIVQDNENQYWVGTDKGVAILNTTNRLFDGNVNFFTPIFENRPLLRTEKVQSIVVDGGNRKWIGTQNGIWLFNPDASEVLAFFDIKNSPLPSNYIMDIAIEQQTGEVFILTDAGLVSYRSNATSTTSDFGNITVFPNPVRPDFVGNVGINGLAENSTIKIVDSAGRLFYETKANGGTASWNLRDYNNVLAETGIYFLYCTDAQGNASIVKKIAVIK